MHKADRNIAKDKLSTLWILLTETDENDDNNEYDDDSTQSNSNANLDVVLESAVHCCRKKTNTLCRNSAQ